MAVLLSETVAVLTDTRRWTPSHPSCAAAMPSICEARFLCTYRHPRRLTIRSVCRASCLPPTTPTGCNAAARLVFRLRRYDDVTDALAILHWLRVPERVNFKLALMAYRVLNGMAPSYLNQLVPVSSLKPCPHCLTENGECRRIRRQSATVSFL